MADTPQPPKTDFDPGTDADFVADRDLAPEDVPPPAKAQRPVSPPTPPAESHPHSVVLEARRLGFTDHDLQVLSTPELQREIYYARREQDLQSRESAVARALPPPAGPTAQQQADEIAAEYGIDPEADPVGYKAIKKLHEKTKALEDQNRQLAAHANTREAMTTEEKLDDAFAGIEAKYAQVGTGPWAGLTRGGDEQRMRMAVITAAGLDVSKALPSSRYVQQAIEKAAKFIFGGAAPKAPAADAEPAPYTLPDTPAATNGHAPKRRPTPPAEDEDADLADKKAAWLRASTPQPTQRRETPPPRSAKGQRDRAVQRIRDRQIEAARQSAHQPDQGNYGDEEADFE